MQSKLRLLLIFCLVPSLISCQSAGESGEGEKGTEVSSQAGSKPKIKSFVVDAVALSKDYKTWYSYHYRTIHLARDFTGLDTDSSLLAKADFLTKLTSGDFIALKTSERNDVPVYTLQKLNKREPSISATIKNLASNELKNLNMEGKEMPNFSFTDLKGNLYDRTTSKDKVLVLKCWFIGCVACVKEFPELNKLVSEYQQNAGVQFVSLAMDSKPQLEHFLQKKPFNYAVVPNQEEFMQNKLGIMMYPSHLIVNREGKIVKVVNDVNDLIPALKKETEQTRL
ncbi:TlpA family protein disulfide reductase [Salmonirosea aquatica]|uniref:Redoxin domain-containing protein n=1 Tax=Salmonirosea aquatica TaxID=2654236 RepID=A0A7C9FB39_9BACT|nr:redoxin domain-containing protein [Cytophagaceae bacterium SJW1-29]